VGSSGMATATGAERMGTVARTIVQEHIMLAGYPMVAADERFDRLAATPDPVVGERVAASFPRIKTRIVMPVDKEGRLARADKVYDVHYGLLSIAALSGYEDPVVPFTIWGLTRDMGWSQGGRQTLLVRRCIEYIYGMSVEIEGEVADPFRPHDRYHGTSTFRVLDRMQFPTEEGRALGQRAASLVRYTDDYLKVIRDPGVQIDVETLAQIDGGLPKAMYRLASWLKAHGLESIDLQEAFERVGSSRKRVTPSDAHRVFSRCWDVMVTYRHIRRVPSIEPSGGRWTMYFDWDSPVQLPSRGDILYREYVRLGVNRQTAESMIRENKRRAARVLQAYRAGALPTPADTVARLLVGVFRDSQWDLPELNRSAQLDLLGEDVSRLSSSATVRLGSDDILGRIAASPSAMQRAEWLRMLKEEHGIQPAEVGYRGDGVRLPRQR
jgi:hypothetical protein